MIESPKQDPLFNDMEDFFDDQGIDLNMLLGKNDSRRSAIKLFATIPQDFGPSPREFDTINIMKKIQSDDHFTGQERSVLTDVTIYVRNTLNDLRHL